MTWYSELLATMQTATVLASIRLRKVASSSDLPRGRRVEPKATSVDCSKREFGLRSSEELDVLRVRPGPSAFDVVHAEKVELFSDSQLVVDSG